MGFNEFRFDSYREFIVDILLEDERGYHYRVFRKEVAIMPIDAAKKAAEKIAAVSGIEETYRDYRVSHKDMVSREGYTIFWVARNDKDNGWFAWEVDDRVGY